MKRIINTILAFAALTLNLISCEKYSVVVPAESGKPAELSINVSSANVNGIEITRAVPTTMGETSLANGCKIASLAVFLVNSDGQIAGYANSEKTGLSNTVQIASEQTTASVKFNNIISGEYTLYYIANRPSGLILDDNYASSTLFSAIGVGDYVMPALTGTNIPDFTTSDYPYGMPITLKQKVTLNYGSNNISAQLVRTVGRLSVDIHPHMNGYKLSVASLTFSKFNPSLSYLFFHESGPSILIPASNEYRDLPSQFGSCLNVRTGSSARAIDCYLFENTASAYNMSISGAVFNESQNDVAYSTLSVTTETQYSLGDAATGISSTSTEYFIESLDSRDNYLYMDSNGTLKVGPLPGGSLLNTNETAQFRWIFSGTGSGTIRNVGTNKYIYYNNSATVSGSNNSATFNFGDNSGFYMRSNYYYSSRYYFINSGSPATMTRNTRYSTNPNNDNQRWYLHSYNVSVTTKTTNKYFDSDHVEVTPVKSFSAENMQLNYISAYGSPANLNYIYRNEYVDNIVDIYYNTNGGSFEFSVLPWSENTSEITFD